MRNILFVSCYSTDINNSASIELIYYINLLSKSGEFNIHLLTMNYPQNTIYYDSEISKFVDERITIHRVDGGFILNKFLPKKSIKLNSNQSSKKRNSILIGIKNVVTVIDPYISWTKNAFKYFKRNLSNIKFDIILGMHEPPSSLICSYKIKDFIKKTNFDINLISYFSDPYCDEISRKSKNIIIRKINSRIERKIINKSDKFLFVTESNKKYYEDKYTLDSKDTKIIHRGFDEKLYGDLKQDYPEEFQRNKINLVHAGDIAPNIRNIKFFIEALDYMKDNNEEQFGKLNIRFFGNINDAEQEKLVKDRKYIYSMPRISYAEVLKFLVNADILIVFGNKEFKQIPAKIYDYMGTNAYIFVILESYKDPLYNLVKDVDGIVCVLNSREEIVKEFIKMLEKFQYKRLFNRQEVDNQKIFEKLKNILE